jgi:hypothetical protein
MSYAIRYRIGIREWRAEAAIRRLADKFAPKKKFRWTTPTLHTPTHTMPHKHKRREKDVS